MPKTSKCGAKHPVYADVGKDHPMKTSPCTLDEGHAGSHQDGPDGKGTSWG